MVRKSEKTVMQLVKKHRFSDKKEQGNERAKGKETDNNKHSEKSNVLLKTKLRNVKFRCQNFR